MRRLLLLPLLLLLSSCQAGNVGRLHLNKDITASFESCTVLPDYDYYYSGSEAEPDVILAVKKSYTFEKGLWQAVALDKKQLCDWMYMIDPAYRDYRYSYDGYIVYSASGEEVGLWYSMENHATIKEDGDKLIIYTPTKHYSPRRPFADRDRPRY